MKRGDDKPDKWLAVKFINFIGQVNVSVCFIDYVGIISGESYSET
jgi:hypothetical protein